jgi:beta-ketodecanoyl-[acyl-carrier-protein] synthase
VKKTVISGTGFYAPAEVITNEELVQSYNAYVKQAGGQLPESSAEFIVKASGIQRRHVIDKAGILDVMHMKPRVAARSDSSMSFQCEFALPAIKQALATAKKSAADIDAIIVSATNTQRPYPGVAIELQQLLGTSGYAYDMRVACSSATFGLQAASNAVQCNQATVVLVVTPEITTPQLDFRDRDSHFIFGDACTAVVIEAEESCQVAHPYEICSSKLFTQFSNNIRSNDGFMRRVEGNVVTEEKLFTQNGRVVFKEVVPLVVKFINDHLAQNMIPITDIKRLWLHQANINMNNLIAAKILGHDATASEAPIILDEYANTAAAGALIAFHLYHDDLQINDYGVLCSFGAGYSIGSIILRRM